jgi:branched-chain amino acid transport system permease protein
VSTALAPKPPSGPTPFWFLPWVRRPSDLRTAYGDELRVFPTAFARVWLAAGLLAAVTAPFAVSDFWLSVLNAALILSIGALGLNLLTGYTGQVSLGHAFFIGLGAYAAGYLGGDLGLPVLVWLPAAGLLGAAVGSLVGPFALRLKGLYLAIVTIGLVFLGDHLFLNVRSITGGPQGRAIPSPRIGSLNFAALPGLSKQQSFYLFVLPLVILAMVVAKNLVRTRPGRALQAIRDREIAASVIGVDLARFKVAAFAVSSFYATACGALFGSYYGYVSPIQFDLLLSIQFVAMIIVGGVGTIMGALLGAAFIVLVGPLIERVSPHLPFVATSGLDPGFRVETLNQIIFGALIVFFLVVEPAGLAGIYRRLKVYVKAWPFSY